VKYDWRGAKGKNRRRGGCVPQRATANLVLPAASGKKIRNGRGQWLAILVSSRTGGAVMKRRGKRVGVIRRAYPRVARVVQVKGKV